MSIERARKILGDYAKSLSDKEIVVILECFNAIIEVGLRQFEAKISLGIRKL